MKITAIIPARKESRRLINKNILPFGDSNLLVHKIRQLREVEKIDEIIVSSEDDEILKMAEAEGTITNRRPSEYALPGASFGEFVSYSCSQCDSDYIVWASVTAPFVTPLIFNDAISTYFDQCKEGYDSLITVQLHQRYILDGNGALNYSRGLRHKESDSLPHLYLFTNGLQIAKRESMIEWKYTWGHIPFMYEVDKKVGIDISDAFDYNIAKFLFEQEKEGSQHE